MKITGVKTVVVNAEMRNWVFVKVETDDDGLFGWGEATLEWKTRSVVGAVEDLAPMIVGENPLQIEHLYQKMYRQGFWRLGIIGMSALRASSWPCGTSRANTSGSRSTNCWEGWCGTGYGCTRTWVAAR